MPSIKGGYWSILTPKGMPCVDAKLIFHSSDATKSLASTKSALADVGTNLLVYPPHPPPPREGDGLLRHGVKHPRLMGYLRHLYLSAGQTDGLLEVHAS